MTLKDMEAALEADWENVVAFFHNLFHKVPASPVEVAAAPSTPVEVAPVPANAAPVETGTDNWLTRDIAGQATPQAPAGPDTSPVVDTSGDTLDFNVVGGGHAINLTGPKTIVNCPANVTVEIAQASGQSGAHNTYTATVNGVAALYQTSSEQKIAAQGPDVTVSVDSPGLQMEIR